MLEIYELVSKDYAKVFSLYSETFPTLPPEDLRISWDNRSKKDSFGFFVRGTFVGFVLASLEGKNLYISYIALHPSVRGKGLGSELLLGLVAKSYAGRGTIHLYPETDVRAKWYERYGFNESVKGYYVFHSYGTRKQGAIHTRLGL